MSSGWKKLITVSLVACLAVGVYMKYIKGFTEDIMPYKAINVYAEGLSNEDILRAVETISPDVIAVRSPDSKWISLLNIDIWGATIKISDATKFSRIFKRPVLISVVFDSDVLSIYYASASQGIKETRLHFLGGVYAEDATVESQEFPEFFLEYCDESKEKELREMWVSNDFIFEEDVQWTLYEAAGIPLIESLEEIQSDGFLLIGDSVKQK
jgi:hypothetical protein